MLQGERQATAAAAADPQDELYERSSVAQRSLEYHRTRTTEDIIESLRSGAAESLKVKPDGRIFQGNTRIKVLEERGYPINDLPRELIP